MNRNGVMECWMWETPPLQHSSSPICFGRAVSQILFLIAIYLSDLNPLLRRRGPRHRSLFGLAPDGVCRAPDVTVGAVSFYLAVSTLPEEWGDGVLERWSAWDRTCHHS